jgi:hypothetical protein
MIRSGSSSTGCGLLLQEGTQTPQNALFYPRKCELVTFVYPRYPGYSRSWINELRSRIVVLERMARVCYSSGR